MGGWGAVKNSTLTRSCAYEACPVHYALTVSIPAKWKTDAASARGWRQRRQFGDADRFQVAVGHREVGVGVCGRGGEPGSRVQVNKQRTVCGSGVFWTQTLVC